MSLPLCNTLGSPTDSVLTHDQEFTGCNGCCITFTTFSSYFATVVIHFLQLDSTYSYFHVRMYVLLLDLSLTSMQVLVILQELRTNVNRFNKTAVTRNFQFFLQKGSNVISTCCWLNWIYERLQATMGIFSLMVSSNTITQICNKNLILKPLQNPYEVISIPANGTVTY